jgi:D-3-phosphoglycerate dehydrogenase
VNKISFLILEPENYSLVAIKCYGSIGKIYFPAEMNSHEKKSTITCIVVRLGYRIDESLISEYKNLKWIISPTTGLTHIDLKVCQTRGISIFSLKNVRDKINSITSTAELTLALMFSLVRCVTQANENVVEKEIWNRNLHCERQISSMVIGLVGFGRIGGMVAKTLIALGSKVKAYDPYQSYSKFLEIGVIKVDKIESIFIESDIISIHASSTEENVDMINYDLLKLIKKNSIFINTARGELVNEIDLVRAVEEGYLHGAGVDVLKNELDHALLFKSPVIRAAKLGKNILITPHIGGCTKEAMYATEDLIAQEFYNQNILASA